MRRVNRSQTDKLKRSAWEIYQDLEEEICTKPATTVLLGNSLIQNFVHHSNLVKRLGSTANLGIGGDKIEHVLWRVKNGSFPKDCRFVILHVGTNNLKRDPPSRIVGGVRAICQAINKQYLTKGWRWWSWQQDHQGKFWTKRSHGGWDGDHPQSRIPTKLVQNRLHSSQSSWICGILRWLGESYLPGWLLVSLLTKNIFVKFCPFFLNSHNGYMVNNYFAGQKRKHVNYDLA